MTVHPTVLARISSIESKVPAALRADVRAGIADLLLAIVEYEQCGGDVASDILDQISESIRRGGNL